MAITTADGVIAGNQPPRYFAKALSGTLVVGRPFSYWQTAGSPGAGSQDSTLNGAVLSSSSALVNGQIPHVDPVSGNAYLSRFQAAATQNGVALLCDRLWSNGGITITSTAAQSITSPTFPARDHAGTTNGDGIYLGVEVSVATGAGTPTITVSYTNQAGVSGRTATNIDVTLASSAIGTFYRIGLQAGDTGVRSVQSIQLSATWTSGTINLVAYRVIAALDTLPVSPAIDAVTAGLPRIFNGTVPFLVLLPSATTSSAISGHYIETHG